MPADSGTLDVARGLYADTLAYLAAKQSKLSPEYYRDASVQARHRAFTVTGLSQVGQVQAVRDSLQTAVARGETFKQWQERLLAPATLLPEARKETIFRTNVQSTYMAGARERILRNAALKPYVMYSAINDLRTRPSHRAMSGYISRIGSDWANTHWPPCGFNCRCSMIQLTERQALARGYGTQATPPVQADPGFGAPPDSEMVNTLLKAMTQKAEQTAPKPIAAALRDKVAETARGAPPEGLWSQSDVVAEAVTLLATALGGAVTTALVKTPEAMSLAAYASDAGEALDVLLREADRDAVQAVAPLVVSLDNALAPGADHPFGGTTFRTLTPEQAALGVGDALTFGRYASASSRYEQGLGIAGGVLILRGTGAAANAAGDVVYPAGSTFKVVARGEQDGVPYLMAQLDDTAKFSVEPTQTLAAFMADRRHAHGAQKPSALTLARWKAEAKAGKGLVAGLPFGAFCTAVIEQALAETIARF